LISISGELLRELVPMRDAIDAVRRAYIKVSAGAIEQPTRLALQGGTALAMLARDSASGTAVLKALTIRPDNPKAGLRAIQALVMLFDGATGTPSALIDGSSLTALRTGAASGVATDLLAAKDAATMAMIGAGAQSADQIRAVCAVRGIREVRVVSRTTQSAQNLIGRIASELPDVHFVSPGSIAEAIRDADVICTATPAPAPLFKADGLPPNVHVNAIGAFTPEMCELPPELLRDARLVVVDEMEAAMAEAGDLLHAISRGQLKVESIKEIGALLKDPPAKAGRWTVFKSVGIAAQDLEVAMLAVARARESGQGVEVAGL
jgi:ornithine cyclodeaminase